MRLELTYASPAELHIGPRTDCYFWLGRIILATVGPSLSPHSPHSIVPALPVLALFLLLLCPASLLALSFHFFSHSSLSSITFSPLLSLDMGLAAIEQEELKYNKYCLLSIASVPFGSHRLKAFPTR